MPLMLNEEPQRHRDHRWFLTQPKPDDDKAVAREKKTCSYQCKLSASSSLSGSCPAGTTLLLAGRTKLEDVSQEKDAALLKQMNALGFGQQGGTSDTGWTAQVEKKGLLVSYLCNARASSTSSVTVTIPYVGACPTQESVCPNGVLKEPVPQGTTLSPESVQARVEAEANAQAQLDTCQQTMDARCEKLPQDAAKRYWETYDNNKVVSEKLAGKKSFCDRRGVTLLKEYTSDEQYDSIEFAKDEHGALRMKTIKQYLQALSNPAEIVSIKNFILGDLADTTAEFGGGLASGSSEQFKAYPSRKGAGNHGYGVDKELMDDYSANIVRSIWHVHAIGAEGNPSQEGPSVADFNGMTSYTEGEAVITYMGKDADGKICFNVKFYTRKNIVVDLGDYDP